MNPRMAKIYAERSPDLLFIQLEARVGLKLIELFPQVGRKQVLDGDVR